MKTVIFILSSDRLLRAALAEQLYDHDGFELLEAETVQDMFRQKKHFDLVLLDGLCAPDIPQRLQGLNTPVIFLLGRQESAGTLKEHAPCLVKPFKMIHLLDHIHACLKKEPLKEIFHIESYLFEPNDKKLLKGDTLIYLTEKETDILAYLCRARPEAVDRETLLKDVWGYHNSVDTHTLETHIYRLRQKLATRHDQPALLLTEGGGYCLKG